MKRFNDDDLQILCAPLQTRSHFVAISYDQIHIQSTFFHANPNKSSNEDNQFVILVTKDKLSAKSSSLAVGLGVVDDVVEDVVDVVSVALSVSKSAMGLLGIACIVGCAQGL